MGDFNLADLNWLVGGMGDERKQSYARQMRGEETADWLQDFFTSYASGDPTINKQTGRKHTVESMVEELKERVRLDSIKKEAIYRPPLRLRLAEILQPMKEENNPDQLLADMADYVLRHHIRPNHGQSSIVALYEALKDHFDVEGIEAAGGKDRIIAMLDKLRTENSGFNPADALPIYDGTPIQMKKEYENDRADFLSQDTSKKT